MRTPTTYDLVFLADDEWNNDTMEAVAFEWFQKNPDCNFVMVYEHAGWYLTFHRGDMEVVHTANDMAIMRQDRPRPTDYSGIEHRRRSPKEEIRMRILNEHPEGVQSTELDRMVDAELLAA